MRGDRVPDVHGEQRTRDLHAIVRRGGHFAESLDEGRVRLVLWLLPRVLRHQAALAELVDQIKVGDWIAAPGSIGDDLVGGACAVVWQIPTSL
jgi:hypothetical protein